MTEKSTQHIQIPHGLGGKVKLKNIDYFIYGELKRHINWKTYETFVAQSTLADTAKISIPTTASSLKRLRESGEIDIVGQRGRSNVYKIKKDGRMFEMISYDLLNSEIFDPDLKGFYYRYQAFCVKDEDGYAKCTYTNEELSSKMNISLPTLRNYFKQLEAAGVLSTGLTRMKDPVTGLMRDVKMIDLAMVCQATLYINKRVDNVVEEVEVLKKENASLRKDMRSLQDTVKQLTKEKFTQIVDFEEIEL